MPYWLVCLLSWWSCCCSLSAIVLAPGWELGRDVSLCVRVCDTLFLGNGRPSFSEKGEAQSTLPSPTSSSAWRSPQLQRLRELILAQIETAASHIYPRKLGVSPTRVLKHQHEAKSCSVHLHARFLSYCIPADTCVLITIAVRAPSFITLF